LRATFHGKMHRLAVEHGASPCAKTPSTLNPLRRSDPHSGKIHALPSAPSSRPPVVVPQQAANASGAVDFSRIWRIRSRGRSRLDSSVGDPLVRASSVLEGRRMPEPRGPGGGLRRRRSGRGTRCERSG
jgi:hypothetical protein